MFFPLGLKLILRKRGNGQKEELCSAGHSGYNFLPGSLPGSLPVFHQDSRDR